jgi:transcriptional regulator with XRE-family HTH domain
VRSHYLSMTQERFAREAQIDRTTLAKIEKNARVPTAEFQAALRARFGVSSDWLMTGEGQPFLPQSQADYRKKLGAVPQGTVAKEASATYLTEGEQAHALRLVASYVHRKDAGRFGYYKLRGSRVRASALQDEMIRRAPNLLAILEDDDYWRAMGDVPGWEFEVLREYLEFGDRPIEYWYELVRFVRSVSMESTEAEGAAGREAGSAELG